MVETLIGQDVPDGAVYEIAYVENDGTLGRLASYVMPDVVVVDGVRYEYQDSAEAYIPVLK